MYIQTDEVKAIALRLFPGYTGRSFQVKPFSGPMRLTSCWEGGSREYWAVMNLATGASGAVPENGTPFTPQLAEVKELPINGVIGLHSIFCGRDHGITLYVHPDNLRAYQIEAPDTLSFDEKVVLVSTRCYKPSYAGRSNNRLYEVQSYIPSFTAAQWEAAKASCQAKGLLNKAGAITNDGRNAVPFEKYSSLFSLKTEAAQSITA